MSIKLTDTQLVMLSAAAQREDRCLIAPETLKSGAAQKVAKKLISAGFAKETQAKAAIRSGGATRNQGHPMRSSSGPPGPKRSASMRASSPRMQPTKTARSTTAIRRLSRQSWRRGTPPNRWSLFLQARARHAVARSWREVIELLQRDHGATIDELIVATGWLAHTTRAALTGLRKRGYVVAIDRTDNERRSFYRIIAQGDCGPVGHPSEEPAGSPTSRQPAQRLSKPRARRAA